MGKLWLPAEVEVYGMEHLGSKNGFSSIGYVQYPLFANNMRRVKTTTSSDERVSWWLSSAYGNSTSHFAAVNFYGHASGGAASITTACVPLCFRIA